MANTPNKKNIALYYIALLPDISLQEEINVFKKVFADDYSSKAAFKSPPHVTLHMPFRLKPTKEEKLLDTLLEFSSKKQLFDVNLCGFGAFPPRVIFVNVDSSPVLDKLHTDLSIVMRQKLNIFNAQYKERGFHPHITIAFRDLKKPAFESSWSIFKDKSFQASFRADAVTLLKHNGKSWDVYKTFSFCEE